MWPLPVSRFGINPAPPTHTLPARAAPQMDPKFMRNLKFSKKWNGKVRLRAPARPLLSLHARRGLDACARPIHRDAEGSDARALD